MGAIMRLETGSPECGGGARSSDGAIVVVGVKLDSRNRELLTWALVKVARSGDRVIALHALDPDADMSNLLALVQSFDSFLNAYEGFCSLKKVDLKLKVCKGSSVRKVLAREAKSCGAQSFILGTSGVHHKIGSKISIAKYCAKHLPNNVSIVCVDNGRIVFQRETNALESGLKGRKALCKSPPSPSLVRNFSSSSTGSEDISLSLVQLKPQQMPESRSRWAALGRAFLHGRIKAESSTNKNPFTMMRKSKLSGQQSVAAVYPDQKQINTHSDSEPEEGAIVLYSANSNFAPCSSDISSEALKALAEKHSATFHSFSYQELLLATNNFIHENMVGEGGSSQVYRGCLPGGKEVAVKILKPSEDILKHFVSEIELISSLRHKNIISLLGFCFEEDRLLLVYNLLSRGSLEDNLHGDEKSGNLFCWEERYKAALGIAEALDYLHNSAEPIIHRDVKSANILLSEDFEAQLSDFGLAAWASSYSHHMGTSDLSGTFGYLAPEYVMHGKVNEKLDVYAFGVVLLELLSGRRPIYNVSPKGQESLVIWAKQILKEGIFLELKDPMLVKPYNHEQFEIMALAATLCIRHAPQSRPDISLVLKLLQGEPDVVTWARHEMKTSNSEGGPNVVNGEQSSTNIQAFINLVLLDLEDDSASTSSNENISVEDYLQGRWNHSSSFD